jgi:hypothetical protein
MAPLEWTKVHPKKAGFYWVKLAGEKKKIVAELYYTKYKTTDRSRSRIPMWFYTEIGVYEEPEEFCGPITPPPGRAQPTKTVD